MATALLPAELQEYAASHNIETIFSDLLQHLVIAHPVDIHTFARQHLQKNQGLKLIILGAPASGKSTQSELLAEEWSLTHLSTGALLRQAAADKTELGLKAKPYMDRGELVPDQLVISLVLDKLRQLKQNWILDGFPRTRGQANALLASGITVHHIISLEVNEDLLPERAAGRRVDPVSGRTFHVKFRPPRDSETLKRLEQRVDDSNQPADVAVEQQKAEADAVAEEPKQEEEFVAAAEESNPEAVEEQQKEGENVQEEQEKPAPVVAKPLSAPSFKTSAAALEAANSERYKTRMMVYRRYADAVLASFPEEAYVRVNGNLAVSLVFTDINCALRGLPMPERLPHEMLMEGGAAGGNDDLSASAAAALARRKRRAAREQDAMKGMLAKRHEVVLGDRLLVQDYFSGLDRLGTGAQLVPNFRRAGSNLPLFGCAQPTSEGLKNVAKHISGLNFKKILYLNMREELLTFVNGHAYCPRDPSALDKNLEMRGIEAQELLEDEVLLKTELLMRAQRHENKLYVITDAHQPITSRVGIEIPAVGLQSQSVSTPQEMFEHVKKEFSSLGANTVHLSMHRVPATDETAPEERDFDQIAQLVAREMTGPGSSSSSSDNVAILASCHLGVGRSTTAMVIAGLVSCSLSKRTASGAPNFFSFLPAPTPIDSSRPALNRCEYQCIQRLVSLMPNGEGLRRKQELDWVIDNCSTMTNLRESVYDCQRAYEGAMDRLNQNAFGSASEEANLREEVQLQLLRALDFLERYAYLLIFSAYVHEESRAGFATPFVHFMKNHPELYRCLESLRLDAREVPILKNRILLADPVSSAEETEAAVAEFKAASDTAAAIVAAKKAAEEAAEAERIAAEEQAERERLEKLEREANGEAEEEQEEAEPAEEQQVQESEQQAEQKEPEQEESADASLVLLEQVSKPFTFPSALAPRLRRFENMPIFAMGQPTRSGFQSIINCLDDPNLFASAFENLLVVNLREEPFLYIDDRSYAPRHVHSLKKYLLAGFEQDEMRAKEEQLRCEIVQNAGRNHGQLSVLSDKDTTVAVKVCQVGGATLSEPVRDISLMDDVWPTLSSSRLAEKTYARTPITDMQAPEEKDYDELVELFKQRFADPATKDKTAVFLVDADGGMLSATGAVIATLIWKTLHNEFPETEIRQRIERSDKERDALAEQEDSSSNGNNSQDQEDKTKAVLECGMFGTIQSLVDYLETGAISKARADHCIDLCAVPNPENGISNIRSAVADAYHRALALTAVVSQETEQLRAKRPKTASASSASPAVVSEEGSATLVEQPESSEQIAQRQARVDELNAELQKVTNEALNGLELYFSLICFADYLSDHRADLLQPTIKSFTVWMRERSSLYEMLDSLELSPTLDKIAAKANATSIRWRWRAKRKALAEILL